MIQQILPAFILLLLPLAAGLQASPAEHRTLCFFSLNNDQEYEFTRAFLAADNRNGSDVIQVREFHDPTTEARPEQSFAAMIESGQRCDGLVISGHHTGSFGGNRARGTLDISFLEQRSCDPQYRAFFQQVEAVWLQGCRTLGVAAMSMGPDGRNELQADYHMQRVGADMNLNGLRQSFADLSFEFSATLDPDNPLASRYLRVFPQANVFGWTKSSPGVKAGSEKSLLYHMSHMTSLYRGVELFDPLKVQSPALRASMSDTMAKVLAGNEAFGPRARQAWLNHGKVRVRGLGYDNPDLDAYAPLRQSRNNSLRISGALGCAARNAVRFEDVQAALAHILAEQEYVAYNLNVIWEVFREYRRDHPAQYPVLRAQLLDSPALMNLLASKLRSPRTGLLMKIEYYSFYRVLTGTSNREAEARIREHARYFLLAPDLAGSAYDIRDFRESVLLGMARHELASTAFYRGIIEATDAQNATLYALAFSFLNKPPPQADALFDAIVRHPAVASDTLGVAALWLLEHGEDNQFDTLSAILAHSEADEATLDTVASVLAMHDLQASNTLIPRIVAHPEAGGSALSQASLAIWKYDIEVDNALLAEILGHPALRSLGLQNVARAIAANPASGSTELLARIVSHRQADAYALNSVAITLWNGDFAGDMQLLQAIARHPDADARTLQYVEQAAARHDTPDEDEEFF